MKYFPYHNPNPLRKDIQDYLNRFQNTSSSKPFSTAHSLQCTSHKDLTIHPNYQILTHSNSNSYPFITSSSHKCKHNIHTYKHHACSYSSNHYSLLNTESNIHTYPNSNIPLNNDCPINKDVDFMNLQIKCNVLLAKLESLTISKNDYNKKLFNFEGDIFLNENRSKLRIDILDEKEEEDNLSMLVDELVNVFELDTLSNNDNAQLWDENINYLNNEMIAQRISGGEELKIVDLIVDSNHDDINNNEMKNKELSLNNHNNSHKKGINIDNEKKYSEDIYTLTESNEKEKHFNEHNNNNTFNINPIFQATDLNEKDIMNKIKGDAHYDLKSNQELLTLKPILRKNNENNGSQEVLDSIRYKNKDTNNKEKVLPLFKDISVQTCNEFNNGNLQPVNLNVDLKLMFSTPLKNDESKELVGSDILSFSDINRGSLINENETENENEIKYSRFKPTLIETLPDFGKKQALNNANLKVNNITQVNNNEIQKEMIQIHKDKTENLNKEKTNNSKKTKDDNINKNIEVANFKKENKSNNNNIDGNEIKNINGITLNRVINKCNENLTVNDKNIDDNKSNGKKNNVIEIKEMNVIHENNNNEIDTNKKELNNNQTNIEETKLLSNQRFSNIEEEDNIFSTIIENAKGIEEEKKLNAKQKEQEQEIQVISTTKTSVQTQQTSQKIKRSSKLRKKSKSVKFNFNELSVIEYDEDDLITNLYIYDYYGNEIPFKPKNMKRYFSLLEDTKTGIKKLKPCFLNPNKEQDENSDNNNNDDEQEEEKEEENSFTISGKKYTLLNPEPQKLKNKNETKNIKGNTEIVSTSPNIKSSTRNSKSKNKPPSKNVYSSNFLNIKHNNTNIMQRNIYYLQEVYKTGSVWRKARSVHKVITKPKRSNCRRFVENPQKFFTEDLCDNVLQSYNLKGKTKPKIKKSISNKKLKQKNKSIKKEEMIKDQEESDQNYKEYSNRNRRKYSL